MMARFVARDELRIQVELRRRDLDFLGHLNQAVYHELLKEGRGALFERLGVLENGFAWDRDARRSRPLTDGERARLG